MRISAASTENVDVPVSARFMGQAYDPTADAVYFAFKSDGTTPTSGDFTVGSWETDATLSPPTYYARTLVGPVSPGLALPRGSYLVWLKITDNPEVPVRPVDSLVVW